MTIRRLNEAQSVYLDFVRAMAAMLVLCGHTATLFIHASFYDSLGIQNAAVLVFFLLSGFLISLSVFQKKNNPNYNFKEFFIDRFSRIYSAYFPALIFAALVGWFTLPYLGIVPADRVATLKWFVSFKDVYTLKTWVGNLLMMQHFPVFQILRRLNVPENSWFIIPFPGASPFWTISIEWWIYMLFGALAVAWMRRKQPFKLWQWFLVALIAIEPFYHLVAGPDNCLTLLWLVGMFASLGFLYGPKMLAAVDAVLPPQRARGYLLMVFALGCIAIPVRFYAIKLDAGSFKPSEFQIGFLLAVVLFSVLFALNDAKPVPPLLKKIIHFFASYSYSLYLIHAPILSYIYVRYPTEGDSIKMFWISIAISNLVALVFAYLFERHYHRLAKWLKTRMLKPSAIG